MPEVTQWRWGGWVWAPGSQALVPITPRSSQLWGLAPRQHLAPLTAGAEKDGACGLPALGCPGTGTEGAWESLLEGRGFAGWIRGWRSWEWTGRQRPVGQADRGYAEV